MAIAPDWIKQSRDKWEYRGQKRPPFAVIPKMEEESVWDYPRPPKVERDYRTVIVKSGAHIIAKTQSAFRILETASPPTLYIPSEDVNVRLLEKAKGSSLCEWKGNAIYWDVVLPNKRLKKVGWSYPDPFPEFEAISEFLSFYPAHLDCYINNELVKPQPGGFYGGWMTKEIVGPVKGEVPEASL